MSDQLKAQSSARPAQSTGIRWIYPNPQEEQKFDGNPGEPSSLKAAAMTLDYKIEWLATRLGGSFGWVKLSTPQEKAMRAIDRAIAQNEIERLQESLQQDPNNEDLQAQLLAAETTYYQLSDGKEGYCRTGEYLLDTKTSGLFWGLNAANVPVRFVSSFVLPQDGSFSLRLRRDKLPVGQVDGAFSIMIFTDKGAKSSCYRITIGDDGNASEFFHYRNMSRKAREAMQSSLDKLEAMGKLTAADHAQLKLYSEQEAAIKSAAKKEGRKELSREEKAEIALLDAKANALKDSKHNTAAQKQQMADIEKKLYIARESFRLQEDAQKLLGETIDITVQFLRAGFVVVRSNESEYVYTNDRAQEASARRRYGSFTTQMADGARIQIDSNGGMWGMVYGRPKYNTSGFVLTQPFELPKNAAIGNILTSHSGDDPGDTGIETTLVQHPEPRGRDLYQLQVHLTSSGRFTPELYWAGLHLPAGITPEFGAIAWDSQSPGNPAAVSGNHIVDVVVESDRNRTVQGKITVPTRILPAGVAALACDVRIHDRWGEAGDGNNDVTMLRMGKVVTDDIKRARQLNDTGIEVLYGSLSEITAVGCDNWLDREIKAPFICDTMPTGTALRLLCRDAGMPPALYAGIVDGTGPVIEGGVPGTWPKWLPSVGTRYLEFMQQLVSNCAPGWSLFVTAEGLVFAQWVQRDRTSRNYGIPPDVSVSSPLCLREESTLIQDIAEYLTSITIIGDKDSLTGRRYSATENLPLGDDPEFKDSLYYVGESRHETRRVGDLQSETACLLAAREALGITPLTPDGLAPWYKNDQITFDPDFRCGDVILIAGLRFLIESVQFASLNAEADAQKLRFRARLAQDVRIPQEES